jgi:branched-chain amino acid transport system ATP-binding protein
MIRTGADKTTTLRAMSGLLKHGAGAVRLGGSDLAGVAPAARARLGIAHVPSGRGLFFGLTVAEHFRLDGQKSTADLDAAFDHFPPLRPLKDRKAGLMPGGSALLAASYLGRGES